MGLLYGRAGRLTAENGGFRPGQSMMYVGLTMTYASTFQILRGFVVVVTAVFSQFVPGLLTQGLPQGSCRTPW